MTPEFKLGLVKAMLRIATVLNRITSVVSILLTMSLAYRVTVLMISPYSTEKDFLGLATIALILICVEIQRS